MATAFVALEGEQTDICARRDLSCEGVGERGEYLRNPHDAMLAQRVAAGELLKVAEAVHAPAS